MNAPRKIGVSAVVVGLTFVLGCSSIFHELQVHRMHMLNRYDKAPSLDPEFSASRSTVSPGVNRPQLDLEMVGKVQPILDAQVRAQSPDE